MGAAPVDQTGGADPRPPPADPSTPRGPSTRHPVAIGLALVAVAVAVRTLSWQRSAAIMNDGPMFLDLAQRFAAGAWAEALAHAYHPLYPLAIAAVQPLFGDWETAGAAVSIASGGLAVVFLYDFLRRSYQGWVPAVGALLLAVHPYAVPFSSGVQSEGLYMALFLGAVAFAWRSLETPRLGLSALAGLFSGLAYLTRPEGLGVALVAGGVMTLLTLRRLRTPRAFARVGVGLALGAALAVVPYMVALERQGGDLRLTRKKSVVAIATLTDREAERGERARIDPSALEALPGTKPSLAPRPDAKPARRPNVRAPKPATAEPAERAPQGWSRRLAAAAVEVAGVARHVFRLDHWIIGALGLWSAGGPAGLRAGYLAAIVGLYGFVLLGLDLSAGYVSMRHALPPLLPLLGYVALGVPALGRVALALPSLAARRRLPSPRAGLVAGLAILVTASAVMATRPQGQDRVASRAAAEWLAEQGVAGEVAVAKRRDAYYARSRFAPLPRPRDPAGADWIEVLRSRGTRYAIIDERGARRYPEVGDGAGAPADARLRILHRAEAHGRWAVVVEIADGTPPAE